MGVAGQAWVGDASGFDIAIDGAHQQQCEYQPQVLPSAWPPSYPQVTLTLLDPAQSASEQSHKAVGVTSPGLYATSFYTNHGAGPGALVIKTAQGVVWRVAVLDPTDTDVGSVRAIERTIGAQIIGG